MDDDQRHDLAAERAEKYAPAPTGGSLMAGVCVAVVALIAVALVSRFYGWAVQDHIFIAGGLTVVGFLIGLVGYKKLVRSNRRATRHERRQIDAERGKL